MNKKVIFSLLLTLTFVIADAQDVILKKNTEEIQARVLEIGATEVKYKKFDNQSGPTYTVLKSDIFMIRYENGDKDVFGETTSVQNAQPEIVSRTQQTQPAATEPPQRKAYIGLGFGSASPLNSTMKEVGFTTGAQFGINFGYLFSEHVGLNVSLAGTSFPNKYVARANTTFDLGVTGLWFGPLFSTALNETKKVEFDFRPTIGFASSSATLGEETEVSDANGIAYGIGASVRFNLSSRFALAANLDYYNTNIEKDNITVNGEKLEWQPSFGLTIGVYYRF